MATELCFTRRNTSKFNAPDFLAIFCLESQKGSPSYNDLAARIETAFGISTSKQSLSKRVNQTCVLFFQAVLAKIIKTRISEEFTEYLKSNSYKRILIQDSTIIRLPLKLFDIFSGVSNAYKTVCNARIQGVYDVVSGQFIEFSIDSYSKNDFIAASELKIMTNDLILRDRGYLSANEIERHINNGADTIFRHNPKTTYLTIDSGKPINLLALLKRHKTIDMVVCLNNKTRTQVRLLAVPVNQEIANTRRMKAKKEMNGHNPSKQTLEFCNYTIFITTITDNQFDFQKIAVIYRIRWKIEIIFKTWKSNMHFSKIHNVSYYQLIALLIARFIMIVIANQLFVYYQRKVYKFYNKELSLIKFTKYLIKNHEKFHKLIEEVFSKNFCNTIYIPLVKYCTYESRKRHNMRFLENTAFLS
jgi:hypothetical protein